MATKYDIFISYRREGGYDTAKHLNDLLVRDGFKVSFDIDTLRSGDFDTQLLSRIEQCHDFILIVDEHAFDRTLDPNFDPQKDWLRCELSYALKQNKNIIPVFLSNVSGFPENLPEDVSGVVKKNGPEYNRYYFDDFYKKLRLRFLKSQKIKTIKRIVAVLFLALAALVSLLSVLLHTPKDIVYVDPLTPYSTNENELYEYSRTILNDANGTIKTANTSEVKKHWENDKSDKGNLNLGLCYLLGYGCSKDTGNALKYISKAAQYGNAIAQYIMGAVYDNSIGVKQNLELATEWYYKAALQGIPEAQHDYAIVNTLQNNMSEATTWMTKSAEQGNAKAQYWLGLYYGNTLYNEDESLYWMKKAADQDYTLALIALANYYSKANSKYHNCESAIEIYQDLASQNNTMAQYWLSVCYANGQCVTQDFSVAWKYLNKAAEQGYIQACYDLGNFYAQGVAVLNIPQDFSRALELFRKAAAQGHPIAQLYLGEMYENGWGVKKSKYKAKKWYKKAERQGVNMQVIQQMQQQKHEQ